MSSFCGKKPVRVWPKGVNQLQPLAGCRAEGVQIDSADSRRGVASSRVSCVLNHRARQATQFGPFAAAVADSSPLRLAATLIQACRRDSCASSTCGERGVSRADCQGHDRTFVHGVLGIPRRWLLALGCLTLKIDKHTHLILSGHDSR